MVCYLIRQTLVNEYGEATGGLKGELIDDLLYDACRTHRYVMFPMNSPGRRKNLDHWTLLVFDTHGGVWMHYNSLRPRLPNHDYHMEDAKILVKLNDVVTT